MTVFGAEQIREGRARQELVEIVVDRAVGELQTALDAELAGRELGDRIGGVLRHGRGFDRAARSSGRSRPRLRSSDSVMAWCSSKRTPKFSVRFWLTCQSSCTKSACEDLAVVGIGGDLELAGGAAGGGHGVGARRRQSEEELRPRLRRIVQRARSCSRACTRR